MILTYFNNNIIYSDDSALLCNLKGKANKWSQIVLTYLSVAGDIQDGELNIDFNYYNILIYSDGSASNFNMIFVLILTLLSTFMVLKLKILLFL